MTQYTIRNVPQHLDRAIRKRAKQSGKSFNETLIEILSIQMFGSTEQLPADFSWLFNQNTLDEKFDEAIETLSKVDDKLWQ